MFKPLDVVARALAIPSIVLSATSALLDIRHKRSDDPYGSGLLSRMSDGFFERIEDQCRARWAEVFASDGSDGPQSDRSAAA